MKARNKPTEWKLDLMSNLDLLKIATAKLRQRTIREAEKMDEKFEAGERDEKQRSKFYAIWYAFEAIRIYNERKGIKVAEPFPTPVPTKVIRLTVPQNSTVEEVADYIIIKKVD